MKILGFVLVLASLVVSVGCASSVEPAPGEPAASSSAGLVCVDGDCHFMNPPLGSHRHCLTPSEMSDCRRHCLNGDPSLVDDCLASCADCNH